MKKFFCLWLLLALNTACISMAVTPEMWVEMPPAQVVQTVPLDFYLIDAHPLSQYQPTTLVHAPSSYDGRWHIQTLYESPQSQLWLYTSPQVTTIPQVADALALLQPSTTLPLVFAQTAITGTLYTDPQTGLEESLVYTTPTAEMAIFWHGLQLTEVTDIVQHLTLAAPLLPTPTHPPEGR